jgi:fatty-acyl-CoA synthase
MKDPANNQRCRDAIAALLPGLADDVTRWTKAKGDAPAIIEPSTGAVVSWKQLDTSVSAFAAKLLAVGLRAGDVVATSLPLLKEHVYLMYACFRIGVIVAPLDLRLKAKEVQYCFDRIKPRAYFFLGQTPVADFRPLAAEVKAASPYVEHWVQFQKEPGGVIDGAVGIAEFVRDIKKVYLRSLLSGSVRKARRQVDKRDACLVIFTTGSTGSPKPALLCHENIHLQNVGLAVGFAMSGNDRMLVNLPPSHVGCATEQLATTIYGGGTCVILPIFDAKASLEAIARHKVTVLGQIPALFNLEWRLPEYASFDLSSLRFAIYGGQAVSRPFLERLRAMAPRIGTGLGLTETAGFCTYTDIEAGVDELAAGIGYDMPACPLSIREPMREDGRAGAEKAAGEIGEICFSGPQVFLGYLGDPAATARAVSRDGVLYTGDMGSYDEGGLRFAGRKSLVMKPKGYQVFPEDVESHVAGALRGRVNLVACVGAEHEVFSEGIVAFVEPVAGAEVTVDEVLAACRDIAAYARPSHIEIVPPGGIPLNRVAKTDYLELRERAQAIVERLRAAGGWDR